MLVVLLFSRCVGVRLVTRRAFSLGCLVYGSLLVLEDLLPDLGHLRYMFTIVAYLYYRLSVGKAIGGFLTASIEIPSYRCRYVASFSRFKAVNDFVRRASSALVYYVIKCELKVR